MTDYYDLVLGLIPVVLGGITAVLVGVGIEFAMALPVSSVVAVGLIGHAMFVRAPTDPPATPGDPSNAME